MSIEQTLDQQLKEAMRAKDKAKVACIRQVRSKLQEAQNQPDFRGPTDDALLQQVIASYVKQLEKSVTELAAGGERSLSLRTQYAEEVSFLRQFLPAQLDAQAIKKLAAAQIAKDNVTDVRQAGKVVGALMKAHRGQLDAAKAKAVVQALLRGEGAL